MNITLEAQALPIGVLTLSPAVDITYEIPRLVPNEKIRAVDSRLDPGGNGLNVGRALRRLNTASQNYCVAAGAVGHLLQRLLAPQLDQVIYEEVEGETRINATAIEQEKRQHYQICAIGPAVPQERLEHLLARFVDYSAQGFGVLTGSLPHDVPAGTYAEAVARIRERGGRAVVDSQGEVLRLAVESRPYLIKPCRYELETLLGYRLETVKKVAVEARMLQRRGVEYVCVSLGAMGAVLAGPDNCYYAPAPAVRVVSCVGAGDTMVAALVAAFARGAGADEALRLGVACAAATVTQPGTELFFLDDAERYIDSIEVRRMGI